MSRDLLQDAFRKIEQEGLSPTFYSYSNLLNAHINSGEVHGAEEVFAKMKAANFTPNVVVYTTMLKGYSTTGEVAKGKALLHEMVKQSPPVSPTTSPRTLVLELTFPNALFIQ